MQRETTNFLPMKAVREAIINAVCHRDYTVYSGAIYFAMYDDRVEIENEGRLPKQLTIEDLKKQHRSFPRNKKIINAFARRGLVESWGRGTLEIIELCKKDGHPEPVFLEDRSGFSVYMYSRYPLTSIISVSDDFKIHQVTIRQRKILEVLKTAAEDLSSSQIREQVEGSERTIRRELSTLSQLGCVSSQGEGRGLKWNFVQDNPVKSGQIRSNPAKLKKD